MTTAEYMIVLVLLFFVFCIGTVIGSFLNVVILRAFSGESIVLPPSKCPKCGNRLKWWHNIPILSYILLRGKCYFCHEEISIQYPIIELITGIIFLVIFLKFGISFDTLFAFAIAGLLIVIAATDIKERVVFDMHTYSLIAVGLVYNLILTIILIAGQVNSIVGFHLTPAWCLNNPLTVSLLGLLVGGFIMEVAARIGYLIAKERAFGEGDTFIAMGLGAIFGWLNVIAIIITAVIIQLIFTLPIFLKKLFQTKCYGTLVSLGIFFAYAVGFFVVGQKTTLFYSLPVLIAATALMCVLGLSACYCVLKRIKDNKDNLTYLPFGPALAIAGLLLLISNVNILLGMGGH